MVKGKHS
jgi:hypothetical protein